MNNPTKSVVCATVAMAAGGFAYGESSTLPALEKAGLVAAVAGLTMGPMSFLMLRPRKPT